MVNRYLGSSSHLKALYGPYFRGGHFREEEPLKGYRQWVLDSLVEKMRCQEKINQYYGVG